MADDRTQCVRCKTFAPPTNTNHTLISASYGWRLTRGLVDGEPVVEWRCPDCWRIYKAALADKSGGPKP